MTSTTERYRAAASKSAGTVEKIADVWTQGAQKLNDYLPAAMPRIDLVPVVERYFELVQRTVDMSRDLTLKWAEAAGTLSGVVRDQAESIGDRAEQAGKDLAREARKVEREQARRAHDQARERYEGLTKAELSDQLEKRDLPKTGTVDELVERLVEADTR
jgi:SAP domain